MSAENFPRLKRAVQALTQLAEVQLTLFPDFTCKADELVLDFDDGLYELVGYDERVDGQQKSAIERLDEIITAKSGSQRADFWTEDALLGDAGWDEIRAQAKVVAEAFGWPIEKPTPSGAIYIPGA